MPLRFREKIQKMLRKINSPIAYRLSPIAKELFLCLLSAVFLIFSFPKFNIESLAWFGFVPLFFVLNNKSRGSAFLLSYLTGLIFWTGIIYWLVYVTLPGTIILILYLALYFAIFGLIFSHAICHRPAIVQLFFIPSIWVLLEYVRSHLFTGFPWALLGYAQYLNLPIIQIADITGVWGVSFLVMIVNVSIYQVMILGLKARERKQNYLLCAFCLFASLSYGFYKIHSLALIPGKSTLRVSVIQGNIPQELKWIPEAAPYIQHRYARLTESASASSPGLIIWPEASFPAIWGQDERLETEIANLAKKLKTPLLIGTVLREDEKYFNSALLIDEAAKSTGRYDKLHLVPFGEYVPLKKTFPFLETIVPIGEISRGAKYTIFKMKNRFAVLICFEDLFGELSRRFAKSGAQFLVNITNDAWYKYTSAAYQHLQASVFRAVENRLFLARAANTGISAFIGPTGKILSLVQDAAGRDIFVEGIATEGLAISDRPFTIYTRYGDVFILLLFIFIVYYSISPILVRAA